jgi:hypothetical protein
MVVAGRLVANHGSGSLAGKSACFSRPKRKNIPSANGNCQNTQQSILYRADMQWTFLDFFQIFFWIQNGYDRRTTVGCSRINPASLLHEIASCPAAFFSARAPPRWLNKFSRATGQAASA